MSYFKGDDGKVYSIFGEGGGESLAKKYGTEVLAKMPLVSSIREGGDLGSPIVSREPDSEAAKLFTELAKKVKAKLEKELSGKAGVEIGAF
jgi:ATP-binding protein involved in chromosome partitioning